MCYSEEELPRLQTEDNAQIIGIAKEELIVVIRNYLDTS